MEHVRVRVEAVRPNDRPRRFVDAHSSEVVRISERLAERASKQEGGIDLALHAVVEDEPETVAVEGFNLCHSQRHGSMLRQRLDRDERL